MRPEPEDYFSPEESGDLSKYAKEAEKIKVLDDGGRWGLQIEAQPEKPPEKKKLPKLDLKHVSKTQILMAVLVVLSMISLAYAASNLLLSRPITETIVVKAPQNVSLSLEGWNREVVIGLNYTFYIIANNPNPNLKARWLLNFTRADGINYDDFELYYVAGNKTITLPKVREANEKLVFAYVSDLPAGSSTHQFILMPKRLGSYQVAICLRSA